MIKRLRSSQSYRSSLRYAVLVFSLLLCQALPAQTWIDSLDNYARERITPPQNFFPGWQNAPLLHAMEIQYEMMPAAERQKYFDYVRIAMDRNLLFLNGFWPNPTASANGVAFLYRITGNPVYLHVARRVFQQYRNVLRTSNGGISHLPYTPELWDDSVYMIGVFLLSLYRATGDEIYIQELIDQIIKHREKLIVDDWGLWVHAWDGNNVFNFDFCSQPNWADPVTRKSAEIWGRGNGWVVLTLSEVLNTLPPTHPDWAYAAETLKEMIQYLPELQDEETGHWYQLTVRKGEPGNYIESSSTAMFGYGILTALKYGIVEGETYKNAMDKAYYGLKEHSVDLVTNSANPYLNTKNVALETCIGDKQYYYNIPTGGGKPYASAVYIIFGRAYNQYTSGSVTSIQTSNSNRYTIQVNPTLATKTTELNIKVVAPENESVQYHLIDVLGRTVQQQSEILYAGENLHRLPLNGVHGGHYILLVRNQQSEIVKSIPIMVQ